MCWPVQFVAAQQVVRCVNAERYKSKLGEFIKKKFQNNMKN